MHEASLARALLNQVAQIARDRQGQEVLEVIVQVGPLSGVEPLLLVEAFARESAAQGSLVNSRGVLTVREVPLIIRCRTCSRESCLEDFIFRCGHCAAEDVQIVQGDGVILESVILGERVNLDPETTTATISGDSS